MNTLKIPLTAALPAPSTPPKTWVHSEPSESLALSSVWSLLTTW